MDASKLTPEQRKRLADAIAPMVGYTYKLAHWMQRIGWDPADPMYVKAWEAYEAAPRCASAATTRAVCRPRGRGQLWSRHLFRGANRLNM